MRRFNDISRYASSSCCLSNSTGAGALSAGVEDVCFFPAEALLALGAISRSLKCRSNVTLYSHHSRYNMQQEHSCYALKPLKSHNKKGINRFLVNRIIFPWG